MRLLVVCLGNICRSPVAEGVLRARIQASTLAGQVELDSAGTGDWHVGQPPDRRAIANAAEHGIDISGLRARQLQAADYRDFDWLLCADRANLRDVQARAPRGAHAQAALLLDWTGVESQGEVPDPYTGGPAQFEHVFRLLDRAADGAIARLREELGLRGRQ
ncbi:low molecular weight protein-tyrosine-phosphatase [Lysobacter sp. cf310]|uniref:low molecular weight protein-tyrosine-phosphatase n=1 Tax=Lysobacter sp. cf310 TaxID=1761790 RepID=UPI0008EFFA65|nr:low molecular weight protein-tyrosine-phosphatase [Lysobacter sp. cf310]SFK65349.1 protein-tyrosine phosphatase [Lysobacter sp. cf310]